MQKNSCGIFTISLDFELYWGMKDVVSLRDYACEIGGTKESIDRMLLLFDKYNIHVTWASVGFLFLQNRDILIQNYPDILPQYENDELNLYSYIEENRELIHDAHFAPNIIKKIANSKNQEVATHTFSHYYCLEKGQTKEAFYADLEKAKKVAFKFNVDIKSLVFPRNQYNEQYLEILKKSDITSYRGNEQGWMYEASDEKAKKSLLKRALRILDSYINLSGFHTYNLDDIGESKPYNIPASRFLRPYSFKLSIFDRLKLRRIKKAMTHAAKTDTLYHLWWHPHNFGNNREKNIAFLTKILEHYNSLEKEYGMKSMNMSEISEVLAKEKKEVIKSDYPEIQNIILEDRAEKQGFLKKISSVLSFKNIKNFLSTNKIIIIAFLFMLFLDIAISSYKSYFQELPIFFFWEIKEQVREILYFVNFIIQILLFSLLITSKNRILRWVSSGVLFLTLSIFLTYYFINGYGFSTNEAMVAISDFDFAREAFNNFSGAIYKGVGLSALFVGAILFIARNTYNKIKPLKLLLLVVVLIILYIVKGTYSASDRLFFIPFKVVMNFNNAYQAPMYLGEKSKIIREVGKSSVDKIVYIVDESIVATKLSLNGYQEDTTPFLNSIGENIFNYGIASSGANCSNTSNTILRSGICADMFPDENQSTLKNPNIWAYAKKAGYFTVFIDAQNEQTKPQNYMSKYDFSTIDRYIQIEKEYNSPRFMNDFDVIKSLKKELNAHKKIFVYINKLGAHFPYEETYPQDKKVFTPTLDIGEAPTLDTKDKMLHSYYNALRWSVNDWWREVYRVFNKLNVLFIYTSDHGQNLFDNDNKQTHCSALPTTTEANVPLFFVAFGDVKNIISNYTKENLVTNKNHISHFNIFPTILFLEGYKLSKNEKSLFNNLGNQKRFFYSGDIWGRIDYQKNIF